MVIEDKSNSVLFLIEHITKQHYARLRSYPLIEAYGSNPSSGKKKKKMMAVLTLISIDARLQIYWVHFIRLLLEWHILVCVCVYL